MVCNSCGRVLKDTAKFCGGCGNSTITGNGESSAAAGSMPESLVEFSPAPPPAKQAISVACLAHPAAIAAGPCTKCGNYYCQDCLINDPTGKYCLNCSASATASHWQGLQPYQAPLARFAPGLPGSPQQLQYSPQLIIDNRFAGLSPYYQQEFTQIVTSGEVYKGKWNWAAFFFGPLWALTKGAWATFLVSFVINLVIIGFSCGWGFPLTFVFPIIYGLRGNYIYYSALRGKQIVF